MCVHRMLIILQLDGSTKFRITLPRQGLITVSSQLDYEELQAAGRTYYMLNISANVSIKNISANIDIVYTV